jgi:hypothetical protein
MIITLRTNFHTDQKNQVKETTKEELILLYFCYLSLSLQVKILIKICVKQFINQASC